MEQHGHFIKYCKVCGRVISQCRCMARDKETLYGICEECESKQEVKHDDN